MRVRTGHGPEDWHEEGPAVARFHGIAQWGTRGAAVVYGTDRPAPTLRSVPQRDRQTCGEWMPKVRDHCARSPEHRHSHKSREALDNHREAMAGRPHARGAA
jgi:hypothetical protein